MGSNMRAKDMYNDDFIPAGKKEIVDFPNIGPIELTDIPSKSGFEILVERREQLCLTQQEVSNRAGIQLRQYQRFESGERALSSSTLRIALAVCDALKLDPHRFV